MISLLNLAGLTRNRYPSMFQLPGLYHEHCCPHCLLLSHRPKKMSESTSGFSFFFFFLLLLVDVEEQKKCYLHWKGFVKLFWPKPQSQDLLELL